MIAGRDKLQTEGRLGVDEDEWKRILGSVDATYNELVAYQEQLEGKNSELEALRLFMDSVLRSISDVLVVMTPEGRILELNEAGILQTGEAHAAVLGRDFGSLLVPGDRATWDGLLGKVARSRRSHSAELELKGVSEAVPLEAALAPRLDDRGRVIGLVLTGRPVGELRRAYADLARSHAEMQQAQAQLVRGEKLASLGRLLAGVAHELNNPISFVYANAHAMEKYVVKLEAYFDAVHRGAPRDELVALRETLRLDRDIGNLREAMQGARDGAARVRDIVDDLRRLSAEGTGEKIRFDLAETARVAAAWVIRGSKGALRFETSGDGPLPVIGREGHVQQVLMNLIQNAVDAVEAGADPVVRVEFRSAEGRALVDIVDNGPGVDEATASAIFDPFFTTKPVGRGTGLGLAISLKIVEEHGGHLSLVPGGPGARFRLDLPQVTP